MHIILTGATGLVGSIALERMICDESIDKVTILSRKPVPQADGHAKVTVIIHEDLAVYDEKTLAQLKGANGCIWAVGPPAMSVTKE
ncbi:nucleoside-diphosphate-sugar epimerase [Trichoderma arundinaceum]|uniref:Nucleoside-diphosphate-sugar epimerase n=1 Tax=Trichoderma arundinaceum TaxID=490622 RepID=A0A395NWS2_TRIAR|nr:nucleoside-diphosphate-sugar epimerase [Trichoderma arundinaceum]